jgi:hypothetical protein
VEQWDGSGWQAVAEGTTIGYKRIHRLDKTSSSRVRITVLATHDVPLIERVRLH